MDVFTTYCKGEPKEMLLNTLKAIKQIKYPHGSYLCDESNDTELRKFCLDNDIFYVTRKKKIDAKAGNINNALKYSTSEIVLILDPDHVPVPDFLDRVLPYFNDISVGFVQCIQSYYNHHETFISRAAAEQSFHFYGPMMMCNNSYNSVQAIGANCTFRRAALNSIGGHASGLAEDMHTSMMLQDKGWKSIYVPESLSKGLCPSTLSSYFNQQLKWSRGVFELLFRLISGFFSDLKIQQKIYYFSSSLFFLSGLFQMFELLLPFFSLWFSLAPIKINVEYFIIGCVILLLLVYSIRIYVQRWLPERNERGFHLKGGILLIGSWWIFLLGFIYSIFRVKVPYLPTPKSNKYSNDWLIAFPGFLLFVLSLPICFYGMEKDLTPFSVFMSIVFWVQLLPGFILFLNAIIPSIPFLLDHFFNCQLNQLKAILSSISFLFRSVGN
ncbi:MAG: glycosyltransferase, partial [Bacteroidota bacterium]